MGSQRLVSLAPTAVLLHNLCFVICHKQNVICCYLYVAYSPVHVNAKLVS